MPRHAHEQLSRRERQIMDIIYRRGQASVADVHTDIPDAPSYSAVRALLRILEQKGDLKHTKNGPRYVYLPTRPRRDAARRALKRLVRTFFNGSPEKAVTAMLDQSDADLPPEALDRLARRIQEARKEGR